MPPKPTGAITPEQRAMAIAYINQYLKNPKPTGLQWGQSNAQPRAMSGPIPGFTGLPMLQTGDPQVDIAVVNLLKQYPEAAKRIKSVTSAADLPTNVMGDTSPSLLNRGGAVRIAPSNILKQYGVNPWDVLRHEFSHIMGLDDPAYAPPGVANAYDVGGQSELLHRDIKLAPSKKRSSKR